MQNQTGDSVANMTGQVLLEPVTNSINDAREALQSNDTTAALEALNEADSQLFEITKQLNELTVKKEKIMMPKMKTKVADRGTL